MSGAWRRCRALLPAIVLSLLSTSCSRYFYYPDRDLHLVPQKLGYKEEEIWFTSGDGTKLFGWFFRADLRRGTRAKGTIVQFHGNAENLSSHFISLAWLTRHGYNLFVFDYRGYGRSAGEPSQEGTYLDGMAALDKAWALHQRERASKFIVHGQSLGGAVAMRAHADFRHRDATDLIVLESTFLSYKRVARRALANFWLTWIFSPLGMVLVSDKYSAEEALRKSRTRLLVIHDRQDPGVTFANAEEIFELASCRKELWPLDGGGHIAAFALPFPENRERYVRLLDSL